MSRQETSQDISDEAETRQDTSIRYRYIIGFYSHKTTTTAKQPFYGKWVSGIMAYFQQEIPVFQHRIGTKLYLTETQSRHNHETRDMTRHGNSRQIQHKIYKCRDWAKTEIWKTMSRDSLETWHTYRDSSLQIGYYNQKLTMFTFDQHVCDRVFLCLSTE